VTSKAATPEQYLAELPEDRRAAIQAVRDVILKNLPKGIEEGMQYGMIGYYVPHSIFPPGYHCDPKQPLPFASLASQKNHMAVYLCNIYQEDNTWFRQAYEATGKKLDMGAGCVRFKKLENLPLDLIGEVIAKYTVDEFIGKYQAVLAETKSRKK
jgi:uncharacterized protein YdhG (YjbR/CyaY superfamily)